MEPDIAGVSSQFKSIQKHSNLLFQNLEGYYDAKKEIESLISEFKDAKRHFELVRSKHKFNIYLRGIELTEEIYGKKMRQKALLREIDIECDKAIGVLESIATPLSKDELDKLTALRKELEKLSEVLPDINYERNLSEAIDEYEKGDYFASALISSRVIIYALNQIPGESDKKKVNFLHEKGIIEKGRKDIHESIIKAGRLARNVFSHDIKVFPTLSEAHSLLGEAFRILEIASNILKEEKKEF